jgi:hypothetical protein
VASFYIIVQYVPDPIIDERINIGVLVLGDGQVRSRSLKNWNRVRHFAEKDIGFLKDFVKEVGFWDEARVRRMAGRSSGTLQLTAPRASLLPADELLPDTAKCFLREPAGEVRKPSVSRKRQPASP